MGTWIGADLAQGRAGHLDPGGGCGRYYSLNWGANGDVSVPD